MGTKIRPFNLHTSVDSHVKGLIDSAYIQARQTAGTDSASTQAMIDSNFTDQVTITNSGTIGTISSSVAANAYLKITDGTNTLGFDGNEITQATSGAPGPIGIGTSQLVIRPGNNSSAFVANFNASGATELYHNKVKKFETLDSGANVTGNIAANIRSNPKGFSVTHTVDSSDNALLVGPINVDSGVTLTINGTLMVV